MSKYQQHFCRERRFRRDLHWQVLMERSNTPEYTYDFYLEQQRSRSIKKADVDSTKKAAYLISKLSLFFTPQQGSTVLCVGCRNGRELDQFESYGCKQPIGIDLHSSDPRIKVMDMHQLSFPDASMDVVYSCHSLEHALDLQKVCNELLRVAKPNGFIVVEVPVSFHRKEADGSVARSKVTVEAAPGGAPIEIIVDSDGLQPDIWDFENTAALEHVFAPATPVWSEVANALDNPNQVVIRAIFQTPPSRGLERFPDVRAGLQSIVAASPEASIPAVAAAAQPNNFFSNDYYRTILRAALAAGYRFLTLRQFVNEGSPGDLICRPKSTLGFVRAFLFE
jgi:SAM-dependent methyltransferase